MNPALLFIGKHKKVILYIVGLIVLFFIAKYVIEKIKARKRGNVNLINPLIGGEIPDNWTPDSIASRFEEEFIGISGDLEAKNNVLKDMYALNQNQMIQLNNLWNRDYSTKTSYFVEYGSIYSVIEEEWQPIIVTGDTVNYFPLMKQRLIDWNLTSENL